MCPYNLSYIHKPFHTSYKPSKMTFISLPPAFVYAVFSSWNNLFPHALPLDPLHCHPFHLVSILNLSSHSTYPSVREACLSPLKPSSGLSPTCSECSQYFFSGVICKHISEHDLANICLSR